MKSILNKQKNRRSAPRAWAKVNARLISVFRKTGTDNLETTALTGNSEQPNKKNERLDWYQATHGTD